MSNGITSSTRGVSLPRARLSSLRIMRRDKQNSDDVEKPLRRWLIAVVVLVFVALVYTAVTRQRPVEEVIETPAEQPEKPDVPKLRITDAVAPEALNVVLITIDTLRADHLGSYGYPDIDTPHIDALTREGVRFANAASTVPFTLPAHSSIMTGTYPPYHGVTGECRLPTSSDEAFPTLAEQLAARRAMQTAGFVSAFVLDSPVGHRPRLRRVLRRFRCRVAARQINMGSVQRGGRGDHRRRPCAGSTGDPPSPFFLWLHLFDPHEPYTPPEPFLSRYPRAIPTPPRSPTPITLIGRVPRRPGRNVALLESIAADRHRRPRRGACGHHREGLPRFLRLRQHGAYPADRPLAPGRGGARRGPWWSARWSARWSATSIILPTVLAVTGLDQPIPAQRPGGQPRCPDLLGLPSSRFWPGGLQRIVLFALPLRLGAVAGDPHRRVTSSSTPRAPSSTTSCADDQPEERQPDRASTAAGGAPISSSASTCSAGGDRPARPEASREQQQPDLDEETLQQLQAPWAMSPGRGGGQLSADERRRSARADPKDRIDGSISRSWQPRGSISSRRRGNGGKAASEERCWRVDDGDGRRLPDARQHRHSQTQRAGARPIRLLQAAP